MMQRKAVSMLALFVFFAVMYTALTGRRDIRAIDPEAAAVAAAQEQLLASTIQIEMFGQGRVQAALKHTPTSQGLGTLVQAGNQRFIMTHNHWSVSATELNRVELRNAAGERLVVLDAAPFLSLVRYQDWGTMVLEAPPELQGVLPATLGDAARLVAGDIVWLASQDAGGENPIGIAMARVHRIDATIAPGLIELGESDASVVPGDSGGGIWHDGKLVGNLWAITVEQVPWSLRQWFFGASDWQPTGQILVGMQPLYGPSGLTTSDLAAEFANYKNYEHGPQP